MRFLKQLKLVAVLAVVFTLSSSFSQAGVVIDAFTTASSGNGTLVGDGSNGLIAGVSRTTSGSLGVAAGNGAFFAGGIVGDIASPPSFISYKTAGAFSDTVAEILNEFSIGVDVVGTGVTPSYDFQVKLLNGGSLVEASAVTTVNSEQEFVFTPTTTFDFDEIKFEISNISGLAIIGGGGGQAFSAVPEPTSLMLVGMAVLGMIAPRRRNQ